MGRRLCTALLFVLLGFVKSYLVFFPACHKNINRIFAMTEDPRWHECYIWQFYLFLMTVIGGSVAVTKIWSTNIWVLLVFGGFDCTISVCLFTSAYVFISRRHEIALANEVTPAGQLSEGLVKGADNSSGVAGTSDGYGSTKSADQV